jgi:squalene-associated FAD-dependent desaturase
MKRTVLVIGGGPAGITAALQLSTHGYAVTLVEEARELGGRLLASAPASAENFTGPGEATDALPPVILGCHEATLALCKTLGTTEHLQFFRRLRYEFLAPDDRTARLRRPLAPAPLHALLSLATFKGLSLRDRWRILGWIERTWEQDPPLSPDLESRTAGEWMVQIGQSKEARRLVWAPLARFLLGADLTAVSAAIFGSALSRCFLSARQGSRLALPLTGARVWLLDAARARLSLAGAGVRLETTVDHLRFDARRVAEARLRSGSSLAADWYVIALPHHRLTPLLPERALTRFSYFQQLTHLTDSPALAIHLWIEVPLQAPRLILLADRPFHWLTIRPDCSSQGHRTLISLVSTGQSEMLAQPDGMVLGTALEQLAHILPAKAPPKVSATRIIRTSRAFLSVRPGTAALRPLQQSPFPNLFLAGDWTDTGLPATLESAIVSGNLCASAIMDRRA